MSSKSYEAFEALASACLPEGCYFIDPRQPQRTAAQFLDWLAGKPPQPAKPATRQRPWPWLRGVGLLIE